MQNNKGMSLIQVMISLGLMSVIGLGVAELMVTSAKISQRSNTKLSQLVLMNELQTIITSKKTCTDMVNALSQTYDNDVAQSSGWDIKFKVSDSQTYKSGEDFDKELKIKRLYLSDPVIEDGSGTEVEYRAKLNIEFESKAENLMGGSLRNKEVGLINFEVRKSDDKLVSCSKVAEKPASEICKDLGGTYNTSTNSCSNFKYSGCTSPNMGHGDSTTQSYKSGSKQCHKTHTCIDGKKVKTTDFCEEETVSSGPSGSECTPGQTKTTGAKCGSSSYGKQDWSCADGYWIKSGGTYDCVWSCFTAETQIKLLDHSELPISQVKVGDYVLGEDGAINEVYDIEVVPLGGRELFSFNDGPHFVTAEHPFKTTLGWKSFNPEATYREHFFMVDEIPLEAGDLIFRENKNVEMLKKISTRNDKSNLMVYNLRLRAAPISPFDNSDDRSNTYFANGYLVHNK